MSSNDHVRSERPCGLPGALVFAFVAIACGPTAVVDIDASAVDAAGGACTLPPGARVGHHLRVVYLVPADREPNAARIASLEDAIRQVQYWFAATTDDGISFLTHDPVVEVMSLPSAADHYATHDPGGNELLRFYENVRNDAFELTGASFNDPLNRWVFAIEATASCEQLGDNSSGGVVVLSTPDLDVLAGEPRTDPCGTEREAQPRCPQVGELAKHVGLAFGLRFPAGCLDEDPNTPCDERALLVRGAERYPNALLTDEDQDVLSSSPFLRPLSPCPIAC